MISILASSLLVLCFATVLVPGVDKTSEEPSDDPLLLKVNQVAESIAMGTRTVWRLHSTGELRGVRIGRSVRWRRDDVEAYVAGLGD